MSSQFPSIRAENITSKMSFDHAESSPTGATAVHTITVDEVQYELARTVDIDSAGQITVTRTGTADGEDVFTKTTHFTSLTQAASRDTVAGSPQSFVGLVTTLHYHPDPTEQLEAVARAEHR